MIEQVDLEKELEELPGLLSYEETIMEDLIMQIDEAKNKKNKELANFLLEHINDGYDLKKALYKQKSAELDGAIIALKRKLSESKVKLNKLKNRFQSIRKIANLRIEEMKHGL